MNLTSKKVLTANKDFDLKKKVTVDKSSTFSSKAKNRKLGNDQVLNFSIPTQIFIYTQLFM